MKMKDGVDQGERFIYNSFRRWNAVDMMLYGISISPYIAARDSGHQRLVVHLRTNLRLSSRPVLLIFLSIVWYLD